MLDTYRNERVSQLAELHGFVSLQCGHFQITDGRWFVLSDDHCRTQKYLLGLALAIPCVSYDWIKSCLQQVYYYIAT